MMTAEDFVLELDDNEEKKSFKLAIVVGLFENETAKIQFDGEENPSEKQYAYLESYIPKIDDRVLLGVLGGTYIILGKVNFNESPEANALLAMITTLQNQMEAVLIRISATEGETTDNRSLINGHTDDISTIQTDLSYKVSSNISADVNGNRNVDYIYVDPTNSNLAVRRKNSLWTQYKAI